jgi:hypothetical protein
MMPSTITAFGAQIARLRTINSIDANEKRSPVVWKTHRLAEPDTQFQIAWGCKQ